MSDSFATPWTVVHQAPLSVGFPTEEHWSGLTYSFPGDLPNPGIEPMSPALRVGSLSAESYQQLLCFLSTIETGQVTSSLQNKI